MALMSGMLDPLAATLGDADIAEWRNVEREADGNNRSVGWQDDNRTDRERVVTSASFGTGWTEHPRVVMTCEVLK